MTRAREAPSTECRARRCRSAVGGAPSSARTNWQGIDYSRQILGQNPGPGQDYVVFTYDDFQSGQAHGPYPQPPNHIMSIREGRWKLAMYHDVNHKRRPQWEMYDLVKDPNETTNIAWSGYERTPAQQKQFTRMKRKLARVRKTRLQPLS